MSTLLRKDTFDIEIDAKYVLEENFRTKDNIIALMKKLIGNTK